VFFIVLTSVVIQGTLIIPVARFFQVYGRSQPARPRYPLEFIPTASPGSGLINLEISAASGVAGKKIVDLHLPQTALVVLVNKKDKFVIPSGGTVLEAGDRMMVLADQESIAAVQSIFSIVETEEAVLEEPKPKLAVSPLEEEDVQ
jgi:cell volume regulation protein A